MSYTMYTVDSKQNNGAVIVGEYTLFVIYPSSFSCLEV